jgi:hypothetical protein
MFQPSLKLIYLFFYVFNLVAFLADERKCANLLRKIGYITCIYCHSENIKKNGRYRSYQNTIASVAKKILMIKRRG